MPLENSPRLSIIGNCQEILECSNLHLDSKKNSHSYDVYKRVTRGKQHSCQTIQHIMILACHSTPSVLGTFVQLAQVPELVKCGKEIGHEKQEVAKGLQKDTGWL